MATKFVTFASIGRRGLPNQWDIIALSLIFGLFVLVVHGSQGMLAPLPVATAHPIDLSYWALPYYALRTTLRMFAAMAASLLFTLTYATVAAKSRRAEMVLIPLLDVLQSVPILGFLSFTVTFFLGLFPGSQLGAECAAIFAIFTSQAWNMAFSFYQSLRTVPRDLNEVTESFRLSAWQRFWQLEAPFAVPGLMWNAMMSMSGGWFFVVASEAISVGDTTIKLPGIGSYLAVAIDQRRIDCVLAAVLAVLVVIVLYDQLIFRPLVAFADKFKVELSASQKGDTPWVLVLYQRTAWLRRITDPLREAFEWFTSLRIDLPSFGGNRMASPILSRLVDIAWFMLVGALTLYCLYEIVEFVAATLTWHDLAAACGLTLLTMLRVVVLLALATVFWVPIGVWVGLRPKLAEKVQPLAQFLAAFPANVLFPIAVIGILRFHLDADIWLSFLVIFGTQWYIVFNVIAGATAYPNDLKEAAANFRIRGWAWWRNVILPGIFPYYVTGALTASGGSWNAAIVAEYVKWGDDKVAAHGIGAYIAQATDAGDFPRIVLGVAVMSVFVILFNRLLWRPLFGFAERRLRIN
ncbi:ABC transporter permease subunit [Lichenihabitans sp. Uapishka_5]|uniref:ABC transporter permease n=1 Tax=Lichenihabitans sp. Uapishka_5 TaxID=3037302 RepID=UPI0029E7EFEB|nr:ABC transporter permease subunit [Lichenihabitans sp. Uapishka_5]MDX7950658.1 ABC transporter permease subunit [Lichenihabitans sp. Uapishka_5]